MGAVQFALNADENIKKKLTFAEKQRIFPNELEIINEYNFKNPNFRDEISRFTKGYNSDNDIQNFLESYIPKNKISKINGLRYPEETIMYYIAGSIIEKEKSSFLDQNFNIFNYFQNIYLNLGLSEDEIEKCKLVEERFQKEFENIVKILIYDITQRSFEKLCPSLYPAFNTNFALKDEHKPEIITLILNEQILTQVELIESISETIRYCSKLQAVNFILIPKNINDNKLLETFGLDGLMFTMLYKLVEAVSLNRAIKSFFLHSIQDYSIIMAPEISNLIIKKLQSETLVALHIGNFYISNEFNKKLVFQFSSTRSLLFVSLENKYCTKDQIIALKSILNKNKSILALSIVAPLFKNMKPEIIYKFKSTLKEGSKLEVVHLSSQSLFNSYFNENNYYINKN